MRKQVVLILIAIFVTWAVVGQPHLQRAFASASSGNDYAHR